jgi:hypothetical protein
MERVLRGRTLYLQVLRAGHPRFTSPPMFAGLMGMALHACQHIETRSELR